MLAEVLGGLPNAAEKMIRFVSLGGVRMRMGILSFIVALTLVTSAAFGGGPDISCKSAVVDSVVVDDDKIVLIFSGRCELHLMDSKLPPDQGKYKSVETDVEHCVVTIVRRYETGPFKSWKDACDKALALNGKKAFLDLQGTITIDNERVVSVRATGYNFAP